MTILPEDYSRLVRFLERNPDENRWFAPQEARDATGQLLPLSQRYETICLKNLRIKGPLARLTKEEKEALAWRWLVISHNHAFPKSKVLLPSKLSIAYERGKERKKQSMGTPDGLVELTKSLAEVRKVLETPNPQPQPESEPKSNDQEKLTVL